MKVVKSALVVVYFLVLQIIVSTALVIFKFATDPEWVELMMIANEDGMNLVASMEYTRELVLPALIITDLIIIIPLLFKSKFSMFKRVGGREALDYVCLGLTLNLIVSFAVSLVENLPIANQYNELMDLSLNGDAMFMILSAGIFAPLVEELCFRYWIFDIMKDKSDSYKILVSALMFGIAHLNLIQSFYAFVMGLFLGYVYAKTKNIWCSIIIHFSVNMSTVIYELLPGMGQTIVNIILILAFAYTGFTIITKDNALVTDV